jgi:hypothetical protein
LIVRIEGWQRRLNVYIIAAQQEYKEQGFGYGTFDCVHFVGNWVTELTGVDPIADYRGQYTTEAEAKSLLEQLDGTLYQALQKRFGDPVHPAKAQRGDIAYRESEKMCGIFFTAGARMEALFLVDGGFARYRVRNIDHAFMVR